MKVSATHKGYNMHATLSFEYPDDEQKLKDALAGEKYRKALEQIRKRFMEMYDHDDNPEFVLVSIDTIAKQVLEETP